MSIKAVKSAYTLIELLTVLSIISSVLSILMLILRSVRLQAENTVCRYNLKQNFYLLSLYSTDNNGCWPRTDYPFHTNQFYRINSQNMHGPVYYLWRAGYLANPKTWYCPLSPDRFEYNWQQDSSIRPNITGAASSYQYRMFFVCNWPSRLISTSRKIKQKPANSGILRPDNHYDLAVWVDSFDNNSSSKHSWHRITRKWNVLFNDSSVISRRDIDNIIPHLDMSYWHSGDWRINLPNGKKDDCHNEAFLWHFFDTGSWVFNGKEPL
ncbi:MAG: type II secretion system protein [Phycisphaerae bacterium]|nr:type II secretion system protein [Phycisphaerae bacterium]